MTPFVLWKTLIHVFLQALDLALNKRFVSFYQHRNT